ncbi:MAG: glycosyltransferase [Bacteroidales bacterium]
MKILQTITDLNLSSGGAATSTFNLFTALKEGGTNTSLLTLLPFSEKDKFIGSGDNITALEYDGKTQLVYSHNFKHYIEINRGFDLYHANGIWTYPTYKTIKTAHKLNKPCIVTIHGMLNKNALKVSTLGKRLCLTLFQRRELNSIECIHATSRYEAECIKEAGIKTDIAIISNGVTEYKSQSARDDSGICRFGFVGRIDRIKNIEALLMAWHKLGENINGCELVIIGGGEAEYSKELYKFATNYKLNNIRFTGLLTKKETEKEMLKLRYLILPSRSENFGMVVPEALSKGIPVIATEGTPWQELNTERCGWWIKDGTENLVATIYKAISTDTDEYLAMSRNGQSLVKKNYTIEMTADRMRRLYDYILGNEDKPDFIL